MSIPVLWMRHGTCTDGRDRPNAHPRPSSPLAPTGTAEASAAAHRLRDHPECPTLVISSPLLRARQTARIVAAALGARIAQPNSAFAEWQAPACVLGLAPDQYPPAYLAWREQRSRQPETALPGGESLGAFADRARHATTIANDLLTGHGCVLIVSHRLLIGAVAAVHAGDHDSAAIFDAARDFDLAPADLWPAAAAPDAPFRQRPWPPPEEPPGWRV